MGQLLEWAEDVWIAEAPQRFFGFPLGTRMTALRLRSGDLWLHSPIRIDDALRLELDAIGPVRHLVAPNKLHHLYLGGAGEIYPDARTYAAPGLPKKRPDLRFDEELSDAAPEGWKDDLEQVVVRGSFWMQEVDFFHPATRTLIVADVCQHFGPWSPLSLRFGTRRMRMYGRPRMPPDWQLSFRDRAARRASFERLLSWDFDRVILAHGKPLDSGAKAVLDREYAWARR